MSPRKNRILLGISGGIAAYKSVEVLRGLQGIGAEVRVVMTPSARRFIQPLTFEVLSRYPVYTELFSKEENTEIAHVTLANWADLVLVAPATAHLIGRMAHGLADDLLTCILLATGAPVMLAPSMETGMYEHFAVQDNLRRLRQAGCEILEPDVGELASGQRGLGRLPHPDRIVAAVKARLERHNALEGRKIVVTASRTEEDIDPVRFLTNRSTGKMGYAVASQARKRGADVVLVSGPTTLEAPAGVDLVAVRTVCEMRDATVAAFRDADALIMAAAVLNFKPKRVASSKIKKGGNGLRLDLEPTEDFLFDLGTKKGRRMLVGFAAETENGLANARKKLKAKNLDLIVLNDITVEGAGFGVDTNQVTLVDRSDQVERLPKMTKVEVADRILNWIGGRWT